MYAIYTMPYLDTFMKSYYNILIVEPLPENLNSMVRKITPPNLTNNPNNGYNRFPLHCIHAFISTKNSNELMKIDELPTLFSSLVSQGFKIDTSITKMLLKSGITPDNGKKLVAHTSL